MAPLGSTNLTMTCARWLKTACLIGAVSLTALMSPLARAEEASFSRDWQQFELMFRQTITTATRLPPAKTSSLAATIATARLYLEQQNWQAAQQVIEKHLGHKEDRQLYFELATIYLFAGSTDKAKRVLDQLDRSAANHSMQRRAEPELRLSYLWAKYDTLTGNSRKARTRLTAILAEHPQFLPGYSLLSQSYIDRGKLALAKDVLMRAKDNGLDAPALDLKLGVIALKAQQFKRAQRLLTRVLVRQPSNVVARVNLGMSYLRVKNYAKAEAELLKARKLAPNRSFCHFALGILYQRQQKVQKAKDSYALALQSSDASPYLRYNYAMLLFKHQKNDPKGLQYLFEVTQLANPTSDIYQIARTLLAKAEDHRP